LLVDHLLRLCLCAASHGDLLGNVTGDL
jgi:hypothetical protein